MGAIRRNPNENRVNLNETKRLAREIWKPLKPAQRGVKHCTLRCRRETRSKRSRRHNERKTSEAKAWTPVEDSLNRASEDEALY